MVQEEAHIQHHAHGDEKEAEKNIPVGQHAGNNAHTVWRTGQQQTCQKGAQRKGKPEGFRKRGDAEAEGQRRHQQNFPRPRRHDGIHEPGQSEMRSQQDAAQNGNNLAHGKQRFRQRKRQGSAQQRHAQHEGRNHDILKNKNGQRDTSDRRAGVPLLLENLQDDGRRGQSRQTPPENPRLYACAVQPAGQRNKGHRQTDLQAAAHEHRPLEPVERIHRQFDTNGKQQHGHAQVGDLVDDLLIFHQPQHGRPAQYARQQKTHHRHDFQLVAYEADRNGQQKENDKLMQLFHTEKPQTQRDTGEEAHCPSPGRIRSRASCSESG